MPSDAHYFPAGEIFHVLVGSRMPLPYAGEMPSAANRMRTAAHKVSGCIQTRLGVSLHVNFLTTASL
jgi:hypothetical protein